MLRKICIFIFQINNQKDSIIALKYGGGACF